MEKVFLKENLMIPSKPEGPGDDGNGLFSFIYRGEQMDEIQNIWGRTGCCVKVFKKIERVWTNIEDQWWGFSSKAKGSKLLEATHIQNIYAFHNIAPRVYAIFKIKILKNWYWAQLTDDLGHWEDEGIQDVLIKGAVQGLANRYHIQTFNDGREYNVVAGKYVDFQGFHLPDNYEEELKQRLIGVANVGKWGPWMNYHSIPELGISGGRNNEQRVKEMGIDKIDFKGKTVLDIGCSEGFFCRYAIDRGAKRVVGIDLEDVVSPVREYTSYKGYYNIDYLGMDLLTQTPQLEQFDIVFFFSMVQHIGMPQWIIDVVKDLLIFEGNAKNRDNEAFDKILFGTRPFKKIRDGVTNDLMVRPYIWAKL
jgi:2-polyprenyl-3-methyl-5-hydroxy-6-metoxy-1,4-benzoquinol methylase